jgi:hypothetical protein
MYEGVHGEAPYTVFQMANSGLAIFLKRLLLAVDNGSDASVTEDAKPV